MTVDPAVVPGLLLLALELAALAAVGYVVVRVALRQDDERMALAQGLAVGPALWAVTVNFILYLVPGLAGAAVGWGVVLTVGAVLAWRAPDRIRPRPGVAAGFAVAVLALVLAALASRQLMGVSHPELRLGLAAWIRAGGFPPELAWSPGIPVRFHYGPDVLIGLLAPPSGPDLALVTELLSAFAWTSFALIVITALLRRASPIAVLVAAPLLLANGLWTWTTPAEGAILHGPIPVGLPEAGLRASLGDIYWPLVELSPNVRLTDLLADIEVPAYTLAYALTFVVLEYAARSEDWSWRGSVTLAGLVGFLGLLMTSLVPVVVVVWAGLTVWHVLRARRSGSMRGEALRGGAGLALAGLLILVGGGAFTGILDGAPPSGLELAQSFEPGGWQVLGTVDPRPGGAGLLGLGPLAVAGLAAVLARRDRLVLALAAGAGLFALAWLALNYPPAPWDLNRLAGHARNLALVALLLAMTSRLGDLRSTRQRYAAGLVAILITWPTVVAPVRSLGLAIGHGVQLANAHWVREELIDQGVDVPLRRYRLPSMSARVADYIRNHTSLDARILAPKPSHWHVLFATGRPNNAGIADFTHLNYYPGPEFLDAINYLEPAAIQRLDIEYVLATDAWAAALPQRAQTWLADPGLFELLVQDGDERLFRVRQAFLRLDVSPAPESFAALRQAVPPTATAYLVVPPTDLGTLRVAATLNHARLLGEVDPRLLHLIGPAKWRVDPLVDEVPDLVVLPIDFTPWMFETSAREPIWWGDGVAVYAPSGAVAPIVDAPAPAAPQPGDPPPVRIEVTDVTVANGGIEFVASFHERSPQGWTGQDWVVLDGDRSPWAIPATAVRQGAESAIAKWFAGLLSPGSATVRHAFRFDAGDAGLSVRNDAGAFVPLPTSAADLGPGGYTLALRLRHEYQPNQWRDAAILPVLRIKVPSRGDVTYELFQEILDARVGVKTDPLLRQRYADLRLAVDLERQVEGGTVPDSR